MTEETSEKVKHPEKSPAKTRDRSHKWDKVKVLKKVVIRRLPPTMTEETFLKQIEPLPDHDNCYFVPADWSLGQDATSRAYINFMNQDDIFLFKDRFDGYVFVDNKGAEYPAIVEFAPFQGLPRNKSRKKDPKVNSIETDPHYISFLETLNKEEAEGSKSEFKLEYSFQLKDDKKITSTPLLQYLANKKQERRDERKRKAEEKRRQRDEERQRKKNQVSKNIPQAIAEEDTKADDQPKEKPADKKRDKEKAVDERREAHDRRRDQKRKEKKKQKQDNRSEGNLDKSEDKPREEEEKKEKDSKKYSLSRREKQRSREESRRAESASNAERKTKNISASQSSASDVTSSFDKLIAHDEVNDKVKEFIKSVPMNKSYEDLPARVRLTSSVLGGNRSIDTDGDLDKVRNKLEQLNTSERSNKEDTKHTNDRAHERQREEKNPQRIRNKDRPTMEIYQPRKMRLPSNKDESGRSSCEPKDYKSNPTSDGENGKREKDEPLANVKRKVSRYSERRSGRAKEKLHKDAETRDEDVGDSKISQADEMKGDDVKSE